MKQLAVTQFFSLVCIFLMWVYTTQGIAQNIWELQMLPLMLLTKQETGQV